MMTLLLEGWMEDRLRRLEVTGAVRLTVLLVFFGMGVLALTGDGAKAQGATGAPKVRVEVNGDVGVPAEVVPPSKFLTPGGKAYLTQHLLDMQDPAMTYAAKEIPRFMEPYLARDKALFPVTMQDTRIGGVHVYVYEPVGGVKGENRGLQAAGNGTVELPIRAEARSQRGVA